MGNSHSPRTLYRNCNCVLEPLLLLEISSSCIDFLTQEMIPYLDCCFSFLSFPFNTQPFWNDCSWITASYTANEAHVYSFRSTLHSWYTLCSSGNATNTFHNRQQLQTRCADHFNMFFFFSFHGIFLIHASNTIYNTYATQHRCDNNVMEFEYSWAQTQSADQRQKHDSHDAVHVLVGVR